MPPIPDKIVTMLVYRNMPSWFAVACYFDWRKHFGEQWAARERARYGERLSNGAVLTAEGWLLPRSASNPRVIDPPFERDGPRTPALIEQERVDLEMLQQQVDHEAAVLDEDMAIFARQWEAVTNQTQKTRRALLAVDGRSEEREAFMARWHGDHGPR